MVEKDITKEECLSYEFADFFEEIPLLQELLIIPTNEIHDSGYRIMTIIGIDDSIEYRKQIDVGCDVVHFEDYFQKSNGLLRMDLLDNGIFHLFVTGKSKIKVLFRLSDFTFIVVNGNS